MGFSKATHRNFLVKTYDGNIFHLNGCHDVVKDDDDELSYREGCLMDFSGAKNILYALIGMI